MPAYDDAAGVTAQFNLNVLARINRELGGDFDLAAFAHRAIYNRDQHRIEMHLVSRRDQTVRILGERFAFRAGETIHTENSYKYSLDRFRALARAIRLDADSSAGPTPTDCSRCTRWKWRADSRVSRAPCSA